MAGLCEGGNEPAGSLKAICGYMKKETKEKIAEAVSVIRKCFIAWKTSAENEQNEKKKPQNEVTTANKEDKQREDNSSERQVVLFQSFPRT
ncbi:hypothetical protein ANN_13761 [Periplaneta americana]|uniref:Uncharacterized protein n=1 Tax=Periplaneta americana TaxID=6978 RepID=A0ABQ8SVE1_PERAM|nr:hypothetical protein ANN_13761 [Periplaneta americana]